METSIYLFIFGIFLSIKSFRGLLRNTGKRGNELKKYVSQFNFVVGILGIAIAWFNYLMPDVSFGNGSDNLIRLVFADIALLLFLIFTFSVLMFFKHRNIQKKISINLSRIFSILSKISFILIILFTYFIIEYAHY